MSKIQRYRQATKRSQNNTAVSCSLCYRLVYLCLFA